jgi:hypothetical protein
MWSLKKQIGVAVVLGVFEMIGGMWGLGIGIVAVGSFWWWQNK